ncbi:MAG: tRNA 2-thiocytidine(32) synthetase TtcA [Gammaproteobacteria bacterium TMED243]|jgi:tRNA 2-thiocytidine biosynthesis protein TtcA|nr:tRNA 2-thiocytidine(32) synthetase TtcA [Gammaproteobacteria bacterium]RPG30317.1 MAG: tRNA 2-thiocytidine(32) synthetase TtcA [Gammaproteobacteria bacterium TMED243]|tara:strand:- start:759 stop:1634 length:876 start_codon:yes stop_codon:yes gene_type:complete
MTSSVGIHAPTEHPLSRSADPRKSQYEKNKCHKKLRKLVGEALTDFDMLQDGDKVMVCLSGGKDSYTLLDLMLSFQQHAPINFEVVAVNLDQKQPGFPEHVLPAYLTDLGVGFDIIEQDTYSVVKALTPEGKTTCPVCSRLRRGILYSHAKKIGATKIALGHHLDDVVETLMLNMFYGAKLKAMPAKLRSDDGQNILIRPLYYCRESLIQRWSDFRQYPIIPCNLCGSQDNLQRQVIKEMLSGWDRAHPGRVDNIGRSINNVTLSHLGDRKLFDFGGLKADSPRIDALQID